MSGERSQRMVRLIAQGRERIERRMLDIADRYGLPPKDDGVLTLTEVIQHSAEYGHAVPDQNCRHPVCVTAMPIAMAQMQLEQQAAMQQQGAV